MIWVIFCSDCSISACALRMVASCVRRSCSFSIRLAQPAHARGEEHEHHETHRNRHQRAESLVHDDLVDDHLREERRRQTDQLNEKRGEQHIPPNPLVLEKLGPEPAEAECGGRGCLAFQFLPLLVPDKQRLPLEPLGLRYRARLRRLAAGFEVEELARVGLDHERGARRFTLEDGDAREARFGEDAFASSKAERLERLNQLTGGVRRRKTLQQECRVERYPVDLAEAADQPDEIRPGQSLCAHHPPQDLREYLRVTLADFRPKSYR